MPIKSATNNPFATALKNVDTAVSNVQAKAQNALFDGSIGKQISGGWVAKGLAKAGNTAFTPAGPAPTLKRPVVMITGLTMQAASFDPLAKQLASNPANGKAAVYVVADGKFHDGGVNGRVMTDAEAAKSKMFEVQYTEVRGAPTDKAPQLAKAFSAIQRATKSPQLDVVAHSAGCTDFRLYLDSRSQKEKDTIGINQAVLIGPASHGTFMGNVGDSVGAIAGVKKAGAELEIGSKLVTDLNTTWDRQRSQVKGDVTIVAVGGAPTAGKGGISDGDGFMPIRDVSLPNANTVVLHGPDPTPIAHLMEVGYAGVIGEVQKKLGQ